MKPNIHKGGVEESGEILRLIQDSFAYMDGRIDPPSSMHQLTISDISGQCSLGEVWTLGVPIIACVFLTPKDDRLYISKLAVSDSERRKGIAKKLVELAANRAVALNKNFLELNTRIELTENHIAFSKLGFNMISEASHSGFTKSTYLIMRKSVS